MSNQSLLLPAPTTDRSDELEVPAPRRVAGSTPARIARRRSRRTTLRRRTPYRLHGFPRLLVSHEDPDELRAGLRHATGLL